MTHLLLRLAVGRGEAGARAAAVGLAEVVRRAASSNASNVRSQTELRTLHAQLRTLSGLCAPPPPVPPPPPPAGAPMAAIAEPPPATTLPDAAPRRLSLPSSSRPPEASDAGELVSTSTSIPLRAGEYPTESADRADRTDRTDRRVGGGGGGAGGSRLDAIRAAAAARRSDALAVNVARDGPTPSADERARRITASLVADLDLALANDDDDDDDGRDASTSAVAAADYSESRNLRVGGALDELVEREFEEVARAAAAAARSRNDALAAAVGLDLDDDDDDDSDLDEESEFAAVVSAQHRAAAAAAAASAGERGRTRLGRSGLGAGGGIHPSTQQPPATDPDVCTFVSSGSSFMEQHWYFCYTCDLTVSKGCCGACAKACHVGHKVVYSRKSRFFCDCGAGSVPRHECQCLMPSSDAASTSNSRSGIYRADADNLEDRGADAGDKSAKPRGYRPVTEDSDSEADDDDDDPNSRDDVDETDDEDESVAPITSEPGAAKAVAALRDSLLGSGLAASLVALCDRVVDHLRANPPWELPARRGMEQSVALLSLPPPFELAPPPPPPRLLIPDRTVHRGDDEARLGAPSQGFQGWLVRRQAAAGARRAQGASPGYRHGHAQAKRAELREGQRLSRGGGGR